MKTIKNILILLALGVTLTANAQKVSITTEKNASNREAFAAEYLQKKLTNLGYTIVDKKGEYRISLSQAKDTTGLKKEGFTISSKGKKINVVGNDGTGVIYACNEIADRARRTGSLNLPAEIKDAPDGASWLMCRTPEDHLSARAWRL